MYERKRRAMDLGGQLVELTERQESTFIETANGGMHYAAPARFFGPDGRQLIPEGHGFFRTPFGIRYKVMD